eukprot:gene28781-50663_t
MAAQLVRMNAIASNLANAGTIAGSEQGAYRALKPVFSATFDGPAATVNVARMARTGTPEKKLDPNHPLTDEEKELLKIAMWASEPLPFDPMEIALHQSYKEFIAVDERANFKLVYEYPLSGKPPMMTHIFENELGKRIIAAKGAPEAILACSNANSEIRLAAQNAINEYTSAGFRVLAVGEALFSGNDFPEKQQNFIFNLLGVIAFYDPPKENMGEVLRQFYQAGIKVKIITGDNAATTSTIAKEIGFMGAEQQI